MKSSEVLEELDLKFTSILKLGALDEVYTQEEKILKIFRALLACMDIKTTAMHVSCKLNQISTFDLFSDFKICYMTSTGEKQAEESPARTTALDVVGSDKKHHCRIRYQCSQLLMLHLYFSSPSFISLFEYLYTSG